MLTPVCVLFLKYITFTCASHSDPLSLAEVLSILLCSRAKRNHEPLRLLRRTSCAIEPEFLQTPPPVLGLVIATLGALGLARNEWVSVGVDLNWNCAYPRAGGGTCQNTDGRKTKRSSPALSLARPLKSSSLLQGGACKSICLWCVQIQPYTALCRL